MATTAATGASRASTRTRPEGLTAAARRCRRAAAPRVEPVDKGGDHQSPGDTGGNGTGAN